MHSSIDEENQMIRLAKTQKKPYLNSIEQLFRTR
jgi:hypothetical protein